MPNYDYIDSNIIIETLTELDSKRKNACIEYLYSLKRYKIFTGHISFLTLGEITNAILKLSPEKRDLVYDKLSDRLKPINLIGFNDQTFHIALELMKLDYNLMNEPADALHLAIAISRNLNRFITLEYKKFNQTLRNYVRQRGIKITTLGY